MIETITIANRDDECRDCKLTMEYKVVENPSWWRRILFKEKPIIRIKVDSWYGYSNVWRTSPLRSESVSMGRAQYFSRIWEYHMNEKKRLGIKGPYKSVIHPSTGDRDGFKTQGEDQKARGGARIVSLDDYRTSRGTQES